MPIGTCVLHDEHRGDTTLPVALYRRQDEADASGSTAIFNLYTCNFEGFEGQPMVLKKTDEDQYMIFHLRMTVTM